MILLNDLKNVIEANVARYPKMQPQDVVKIVYQHVFGNGPVAGTKEENWKFIQKEYETVRFANQGEERLDVPFMEDLGNWYARINLLAVPNETRLETLNDAYMATACINSGNMEYFLSRLYFLKELTEYGMFEFGLKQLEEYLSEYEKMGYPSPVHSGRYKEFYDPAYRVIDVRYIRLFELIETIRSLLKEKGHLVVAFDGRKCAGKNLAADLLTYIFDATVIHMDDFVLPYEKRTKERMLEPGGCMDVMRFRDEVARHLKKREDFSYRRYDEVIQNLGARVDVENKPLMIVEGTYSQHIEYRYVYDLKVFFDVSTPTQQQMLYQQGGPEYLEAWNNFWLPLQENYFEQTEIKDKSDLVIEEE